MSGDRCFSDPIYDYIRICPTVCAFIDSPQFQRLREIKQLGTSYLVWPGASHNRFEHSLGVACLARVMAEHLAKNQPELGITERDVLCVELAGLCHDLGHGPWSHVWDNHFIPKALKGKTWKHEDASEMMFDALVQEMKIDFPPADCEFVKALIAGDPGRCNGREKTFLFEIVANKRNGIDVDKFDYIARDSRAIGEKGNISLTRLIHSARVIENQICYDIKDANQIYELCYTRFSLHKRIYNHKTAKAIEYMIIDALLAADPIMKIAQQIHQPEKYIFLTDDLRGRIQSSDDPRLAEARAILNRVTTRRLYKCVDYKVIDWADRQWFRDNVTPEKIVEAAKNHTLSESEYHENEEDTGLVELEDLEPKHVIVDLAPMHYGMQDKNPLDFVKFYSKHNPDKCATPGPGDVSLLMPAKFAEVLLRIYTKEDRFFGIVQAGYRAILKNRQDDLSPGESSYDYGVDNPPVGALTPTPTLPPTSPRNLSISGSSSKTTPFNVFMTVPRGFPKSPSQGMKMRSQAKREREDDPEAGRAKKRRTA
ncbi:hypothetical protein JAAARDRAFT_168116 [Jaapia argillacea MUCL 33604]|uniref:HD domain-containing protein n=1 Tax=Jaapia argillacea MUCL 33604 TaxID=933084 RepID=A0A067QDZ5_9AGAM|nr:hypothetical protein JAAARDRAFT_168116 [Jaapia argillacea MUCL 33604]